MMAATSSGVGARRRACGAGFALRPAAGEIGDDEGRLRAQRHDRIPVAMRGPCAEQQRAPALRRGQSFEPGSGVHTLSRMRSMVILGAACRPSAPAAAKPARAGARRRNHTGAVARALKQLFLQE